MATLNEMYASLADETPNLYPQSFIALDNDVFKVAALYAPLTRALEPEELITMYSAALGDNFSVWPESIEFLSEVNGKNLITAMVHANIVSKPFDEKKVRASMKCLSANVFMDEENSIWKVAGKGEQARLVQSKRENFKEILRERINSQQNVLVASACTTDDISAHETQNGDYVLYYSAASRDLSTGFAFTRGDNYVILSHSTKEYEEVSTHNIVRAAEIEVKRPQCPLNVKSDLASDLEQTGGEFTKSIAAKFRDYMKFLYDGTDYFKKLDSLLTMQDQAGRNSLPINTMR